MNRVNYKRIAIGAIAGSAVWSIWTSLVTMTVLMPVYATEQKLGHVLAVPRFGFGTFFFSWFVMLILVTSVSGYIYACLRSVIGAGPKSALKVGLSLGFIAAVPANLSVLGWSPMIGKIPMIWTLDTWLGITLATCTAALIYRDHK